MVYFCAMSKRFNIVILITFLSAGILTCHAQQQPQTGASKSIYLTPMCVYNGDTIPYVKLPTVYIFKPLKFKNRREMAKYYKLIRDVKKVLPISKEINRAIIETYEYLQTIPTQKERQKHLKAVEKGVERTIHSPYEKAFLCTRKTVNQTGRPANPFHFLRTGKKQFMGPFKAGILPDLCRTVRSQSEKTIRPYGR